MFEASQPDRIINLCNWLTDLTFLASSTFLAEPIVTRLKPFSRPHIWCSFKTVMKHKKNLFSSFFSVRSISNREYLDYWYELYYRQLYSNQIDVRSVHSKRSHHQRNDDESENRKCPHAAIRGDAAFNSYFLPLVQRFCFYLRLHCCFNYVWIEIQTQNANKSEGYRHYSKGVSPSKRIQKNLK